MRIRTVPALLMLLLVTTGLFTMHTLGHQGAPAAMDDHHAVVTLASPGDGFEVVSHPDAPGMPMGSLAVCVAILCGLTVLAVAGLLSGRLHTQGLPIDIPHSVADVPERGPPTVLIGLTLADLAVWRN